MGYDAAIARLPLTAIIDLRGPAAKAAVLLGEALLPVPSGCNRCADGNAAAVLHVGPAHWLVLAPLSREAELMAALVPKDGDICVTLVSDAYSGFAISGPAAADVLAQATPLDFHASAFPPDGASFTELFSHKALLRRRGEGFECWVDSTYGDYMADFLSRCGGRMI